AIGAAAKSAANAPAAILFVRVIVWLLAGKEVIECARTLQQATENPTQRTHFQASVAPKIMQRNRTVSRAGRRLAGAGGFRMLRRPAREIPLPMVTTLYALKPKFQELLRPLVGRLAAAGVTANEVTVLALAMSVAAGACVAMEVEAGAPFLLLPLVFLARMTLNAIDGMLAREFGQQSPLGAY